MRRNRRGATTAIRESTKGGWARPVAVNVQQGSTRQRKKVPRVSSAARAKQQTPRGHRSATFATREGTRTRTDRASAKRAGRACGAPLKGARLVRHASRERLHTHRGSPYAPNAPRGALRSTRRAPSVLRDGTKRLLERTTARVVDVEGMLTVRGILDALNVRLGSMLLALGRKRAPSAPKDGFDSRWKMWVARPAAQGSLPTILGQCAAWNAFQACSRRLAGEIGARFVLVVMQGGHTS